MGDSQKECRDYGDVTLVKKGVCTYSPHQNLKAVKTDFRWTINDFPKISKKFPTYRCIRSAKFKIDKCGEGNEDGCGDYSLGTSLYLRIDGGNVKLYFFIESIDGKYDDDERTIEAHVKFSCGDGAYEKNDHDKSPPSQHGNRCVDNAIGFSNFIQRDQLLTFVKDHQLVIDASLTIYHHHRKDYQRQYQTLRMLFEEQLGDFTIQCQGKEVKVWKKLLAKNSSVFARMLESDLMEAKEGVLIIDEEKDDLDYDTIASMVKYFYIGELLEDMDAAQLLKAAEKYDIVPLKRLCIDRLVSELSLVNACEMLAMGDLYGAAALKKAAMALICAHSTTAKATDGWKWLSENIPLVNEVEATLKILEKKKKDKAGERKRKRLQD